MKSVEDLAPKPKTDWRPLVRTGAVLIFLTFGVFGAWSAVARLDGAVIGSGVVAVESSKKTVQHFEGGIVRAILVREGAHVEQGDVLVRLDPTRAEASFDLYRLQLAAALANETRLVSERDDLAELDFPPEVLEVQGDSLVTRAVTDQRRQFQARRDTLQRQIEVLRAQIDQIRNEIEGIKLEQKTAEGQLVFIAQELVGLRGLLEKKYIELPRVSNMEREQLRLQGVIARSTIDAARAAQRIGETELKIEQLRLERREEASKQLPEVRKAISDIRQQMIIASDTLKRIEIRAPVTGTVQQIRIFTIGGVVRASEPIMDVVPVTDELVVRARIAPQDMQMIRPGLPAEVRFPALLRPNVPFIVGKVRTVSTDRLIDEATREPYFAAEVAVERSTILPEIQESITAGLSADVIIPTRERTALEYLVSPITDRFQKAMRER